MLDKNKFLKLENRDIYVSSEIDLETPIFRYTSLYNLLMLLRNQFYVAQKKKFSDKLEFGECLIYSSFDFTIAGEPLTQVQLEQRNTLDRHIKETRNWFTSSWTLKQEEDFFFWKTYTEGANGVRIETTPRLLLNSLNLSEYEVFVSKMKYETKKHIVSNITDYVFYKYDFYRGEEELRFYIIPSIPPIQDSVYLKVNDVSFIKELRLSPFLRPLCKGELRKYIVKEYGIKNEIIKVSGIEEKEK